MRYFAGKWNISRSKFSLEDLTFAFGELSFTLLGVILCFFSIIIALYFVLEINDYVKKAILLISAALILFLGAILLKSAIKSNTKISNCTNISFKYGNEKVVTSDSLNVIFDGSKYLILLNKTGALEYFETAKMERITTYNNVP